MIDKTDSKEIRWQWFEHLISLKIAELIVEENKILTEELTFKNKKVGVYILVHPKTRQAYIGSTDDLYERRYKHFWHIKRNDHRNRKIKEAFISIPSEIIYFFTFPTSTRDQSFDLEQKFIDSYIDNPKCLNIALDSRLGGKGIKFSEERKKQISNTVREKWKDPLYRKLKSDITKAHLAIPENRAKMIANVKKMASNSIFKEKQKINADKQWSDLEARKRKSEEVKLYMSNPENKKRISDLRKHLIKQVSIKGIIYSSRKDAANSLKLSVGTITKHILNKNKSDWFYIKTEGGML